MTLKDLGGSVVAPKGRRRSFAALRMTIQGSRQILSAAKVDSAKPLPKGALEGNSVLSGVPVVQFAGDGFFFLGLPGPVFFPEVGAGEQFFGALH